jgi:adenylate kinase family enzyme
MAKRIHILGASGAGTTTLGSALAACLGCPHLDTDEYFWLPTDPPFQQARSRTDRQALLGAALARHEGWVLSGSLCGWGDLFIPLFDIVVFLWVPPAVRLARLAARERRRFGEAALVSGGARHAHYIAFMAWAAAYDDGGLELRSRRLHEQWLRSLPCPVLRLEGRPSLEESLAQITRHVSTELRPAERHSSQGDSQSTGATRLHSQEAASQGWAHGK